MNNRSENLSDVILVIRQFGQLIDVKEVSLVSRDPNDDVHLAAAAEGQADFLVSGDNDLLSLRDSVPIKIVSPAEFLDVLEGVP